MGRRPWCAVYKEFRKLSPYMKDLTHFFPVNVSKHIHVQLLVISFLGRHPIWATLASAINNSQINSVKGKKKKKTLENLSPAKPAEPPQWVGRSGDGQHPEAPHPATCLIRRKGWNGKVIPNHQENKANPRCSAYSPSSVLWENVDEKMKEGNSTMLLGWDATCKSSVWRGLSVLPETRH